MSRLITTALAVVIAAGSATPALAAPAAPAGAPSAAVAEAAEEQLLPLPAGTLAGAGTTGYLVRDLDEGTYSWVRFDTGAVTELPFSSIPYIQGADSVAESTYSGPATKVRDMKTGTVVLTVDNDRLYRATVLGAAGSTLLAVFPDDATGRERPALFRPGAESTAVGSWATGLPVDATSFWAGSVAGSSVSLSYTSGGKRYQATLDLASGAVSGARESSFPGGATNGDSSPTLRAWLDEGSSSGTSLVLENPKTAGTRSHHLGYPSRPSVSVLGDWALYADARRSFMEPSPLQALRARSFSGTEFKLLDTFAAAVREPDGTLLVQGGTLAQGEGLFRIRAGADGKPVVTMIATNKVPVKLVLGSPAIPSTIDLGRNGGTANLDWTLSRINVEAKVTLRHRRTGKTLTTTFSPPYDGYPAPHTARFHWDGTIGGGLERALNGPYDWQFTATPLDGLGPAVSSSGSFTVTREVNPRDLNDNGSPDLLVRDRAGTLTRLDTFHVPADRRIFGQVDSAVGGGWQIYDRVETTGNLGGTAVGDLVARDRSGVLWLYQGNNRGGFLGRVQVGGGWQAYDKLAGGSDLTGDGRNDLVATDRSGVLWLYPGTGSATRPFATRKKIGGGWQAYDRIAATGNLAGGAAGDLVARDRAGVLWLYLGKGDGTFAPRTRIGGGWNAYTDITGAADMNDDGRNDLVAMDSRGETFVHQGTGSWKAPFQRGYQTGGSQYEHDLMS
ncbi:FG-GAP repeat domain-containing protein [Streptomyces hydrogenans]|uniref:FG-GAP repeat domain-containing protein n=1 Tax=Streptomyces hydrogenans TaxID=1873719 RepID=UPI0036BD2415